MSSALCFVGFSGFLAEEEWGDRIFYSVAEPFGLTNDLELRNMHREVVLPPLRLDAHVFEVDTCVSYLLLAHRMTAV